MPILLSMTSFKFYFIFNSRNGTNNIFYLSLLIPIPVSIISVSKTWVGVKISYFFYQPFYLFVRFIWTWELFMISGFSFKIMIILPLY